MIPILLKLRALPWRWIGAVAVLLLCWWQIHSYGNRREMDGRLDERAARQELDAKAAAEHNAIIDKLNEDHHAASKELEGRLQAALARPPAVRIVRVRDDTACPAPVPADAGEPPAADTGRGPAREGEADYLYLRNELLKLGADAETWRRAVIDARDAWPK